MSSSSREIARQFIKLWNAGRLDVIDEYAHPDILVDYPHFPEPLHGAEAFREMMEMTHRYFPDLKIETHTVVANNGEAAVRWTYRGTHTTGEMFGVEADGTRVEVTGMTMYRIEDGRVTEERGVVDNLGLMQQLGAMN
ncbi:MAG: DUF4440 domain-containing protein [Bacteroidetes bacterium]|jgi:steroid delta-isomerase-like uncharacterized protein|nr:DUF4440 domain-containing protein [Bacteroidota bacterium]